MDKLKEKWKDLSLRKAMLIVSGISLSIVGVLSAVTILTASGIRQKMLDRRPILITAYTIEERSESAENFSIDPEKYTYGNLTGRDQFLYRTATAAMILLPVVYIAAGSAAVAKIYYRWKLQIPIRALRSGMAHISDQDLDFQISYTSGDELGRLCSTFEQMRSEVYKRNREMWEMLKERKALTASVSHDLRTPVTVIRGYLDYIDRSLEKGVLTEDTLKMTVQNMSQAADRLERYIDCVKDIQKIEDIEIQNRRIELGGFLSQVSKDFTILAEQRGKSVKIQDHSGIKEIVSDDEMLSKILENLFDNALRFADHEIRIEVAEDKDSVLFSVQDDGSGFTEEELKTAASLFYSSPAKGGNFGIGLSICKILCEKLGGRLRVENQAGSGARVTAEIKNACGFSKT